MKGDRKYNEALKMATEDDTDLERVFNLLNQSRNLGNAKATYALGTWYLFGKFVKKDTKKAIEFFKYAADKQVSEACYDLALSYEKGVGTIKNLRLAFQYYVKAALLNDTQSLYEVGRCYFYGIGVEKDKVLSSIWLETAKYYGVTDVNQE